jgi:predicted metalloprotease with PDZ domain
MKTALIGFAAVTMLAAAANAEPDCRPLAPPQDQAYPGSIRLSVDATDIAHRVFHVHETVPVAGGKELALLYPEWLPGTHAPQGLNHINKLAGLVIKANGANINGAPLAWERDPCDIFAFRVHPPAGAASIDIDFDYLSPDGAQNGPGAGQEISQEMLVLEWGSLVLCPAGHFVSRIQVEPSVTLPQGWEFATALDHAGDVAEASFKPVSLETLVDSPLFAGKYAMRWDLDPGAAVPVHLDAFADRPDLLKTKDLDKHIDAHRALIQQAYKLFGSKHYDHYDFLVTLSDNLGDGGLEHHRSSEDNTKPEYFTEWDSKTVATRDLLPHEYTHSWNGKFRRPKDLWTPNYNVPMDDSLLWVYEGQTQYWGQVLAARSGLWSKDQALDSLAGIAAYYQAQAGRGWRNLQDTTYDEIISPRFLPHSWASWRRGQDYYDEGLLLWLDVDTLIREQSQGQHSLDDFARGFFGIDDGGLGPKLYAFDDVVHALNAVQPYDWAKFLRERLDSLGRDPLDGITRGGYRLTWSDTPSKFAESVEKLYEFTGFTYSLGITLDKGGKIRGVLWNSPAFKAGLSPGVQIQAVNGMAYSAERIKDAVKNSSSASEPIELIVKDQDHYRIVRLDYHGGARYPHLERVDGTPARLDDILAAK